MAYARIPEPFRKVSLSKMEFAITEANLGRENTAIARLRLIDKIPQIDIAEELGIDRKTVSDRLEIIYSRVEEIIKTSA